MPPLTTGKIDLATKLSYSKTYYNEVNQHRLVDMFSQTFKINSKDLITSVMKISLTSGTSYT